MVEIRETYRSIQPLVVHLVTETDAIIETWNVGKYRLALHPKGALNLHLNNYPFPDPREMTDVISKSYFGVRMLVAARLSVAVRINRKPVSASPMT